MQENVMTEACPDAPSDCSLPRHRFRPGPLYWNDRCLVCSHWSNDDDHGMHIPWWKFWERSGVRHTGRRS